MFKHVLYSFPTVTRGQILHIRSSLGLIALSSPYLRHVYSCSRVAQWKRAGPITQRSMDRNHSLLYFFAHARVHVFALKYGVSLKFNSSSFNWNSTSTMILSIHGLVRAYYYK